MGSINDISSLIPTHSPQFTITLIPMNHYHEGLTNHSLFLLTISTHMNLMNSSPSSTIRFNFNNEHVKKTGNGSVSLPANIGSTPSTIARFLNYNTYNITNYLSILAHGWYIICPFMHVKNSDNDQLEPIMMLYLSKMKKVSLRMKKGPSSVMTHSKKGVML